MNNPQQESLDGWLRAFEPGESDLKTQEDVARVRALVASTNAPCSRKQFDPGHLTASALVFDPTGQQVLLIHHAKLERWLQPGGHVEPGDEDLLVTALREVREETGLVLARPDAVRIIGVDVHPIPAKSNEPAHHHFDVMFALQATDTATRACEQETRGVAWVPVEQLVEKTGLERFQHVIARAAMDGHSRK